MKHFKKLCACLMCAFLLLSHATLVFAADSTVTYKGRDDLFEFAPGSVYTSTDLFDNFKDVMPGDKRTETVTITNECRTGDYIKVWMRALLHDTTNNPLSPEVLKALSEDERRGAMSELEYMHDFLEQLTLTVWNGERTDENIIYQGMPDSLDGGFEEGNVFLGSLAYKQSLSLNVELAVNINMGNEYSGRIGEIDWVFVIEERYTEHDSGGTVPPNKETKPDSGEAGEESNLGVLGEVEDDGFHLNVLPLTGDNTMIWPYVIVGLMALIGLIILLRKKKEEEE